MRKALVILGILMCSLELCQAQGSKDAIMQDARKAFGLYYVYDYKVVPELTAAPEGFKPIYVSHLGRHGARYCENEYDSLAVWFSKAARMGMLTDYGKEFHSRFVSFYGKVRGCKGNLTEIGKDQLRSIATTLYTRFPEVFDGPTRVEAFSTESARVINSMWTFLSTLQSLDRDIAVNADASSKYASWLQPLLRGNPYAIKGRPNYNAESDRACTEYSNRVVPWEEIARKFFIGPDVIGQVFKTTPELFVKYLHALVAHTYCLPEDRGCFDDVLSAEEMYLIWKSLAARNFLLLANYEGSGNVTVDYSAFTLENIIQNADEDISSGKTRLRLRFGHDSGVMPLLTFLDVDGFGRSSSSFEEGIDIFPNYHIPMGASVQFVFFRKEGGDDILLKVLLNEREVSLPIPAVSGPYYRWSEFKAHYNPLISASKEKIERARSSFAQEKRAEALDPQKALEVLKAVNWNWRPLKGSYVEEGKASVRVFGSVQSISMVRFPMNRHSVSVVESDGASADVTSRIARRNNAIAAINGGFFNTKTLFPVAFIKDEGRVICSQTADETTRCNGMLRIGGRKARKFDILSVDSLSAPKAAKAWREAMVAGPILLENGKWIKYVSREEGAQGDVVLDAEKYRRFYARRQPRTLIGYTSDGWIYFVVVDGRTKSVADGLSIPELQILAESLGLYEAINLDGGGSSTLWNRESGILNHPCDNKIFDAAGERKVPNAIIVK